MIDLLKTIDQINITQLKMKHSPDQPQDTSRKVRTCRLSDEEYKYLESRHNGLSAAIRLLTKGGKYEQLVKENEQLINKLKYLQG